jgi:H2-forming N5,N10-methylenetetrahydromethanopterin dehydrogenase-like enzyme
MTSQINSSTKDEMVKNTGPVDHDVLFTSKNEDKKAEELCKLLNAAGMDVTEDLSDGSLVEVLN